MHACMSVCVCIKKQKMQATNRHKGNLQGHETRKKRNSTKNAGTGHSHRQNNNS